jgi:hypothetical protein
MTQDKFNESLSGEWLLLFNDEIVDHSANIEDMLKLAEERFPADKFPNDDIKISKVIDQAIRGL